MIPLNPDADLEQRIKAELDACHAAKAAGDTEAQARHWNKFVSLIASRSPKRVRRMEREKGLT